MDVVAGNKSLPDRYSWHQIGSWERQPDTTVPDFDTLRSSYNLPKKPIDLNEYAWTDEQNPSTSVYYLSQLERHNVRGLRANWGSGGGLHDYLANLVYKNDAGEYHPNGEWHLYKYYASMTGDRLATSASDDLLFDVFSTISDRHVKILAGTRTIQAPYDVSVGKLSALGLPRDGKIGIRTYRFDWNGQFADVKSPVDLGCSKYSIVSDQVRFLIPSGFDGHILPKCI